MKVYCCLAIVKYEGSDVVKIYDREAKAQIWKYQCETLNAQYWSENSEYPQDVKDKLIKLAGESGPSYDMFEYHEMEVQ